MTYRTTRYEKRNAKPKKGAAIREKALGYLQKNEIFGADTLSIILIAQLVAKHKGHPFGHINSKTLAKAYLRAHLGMVTPQKKIARRPRVDVNSEAFLQSYEWRSLRMRVLRDHGARCMCCGATPDDGLRMHVDHIKPRRQYPHLALEYKNLQVLCEVCNHGKGNWDQTDWRRQDVETLPPGAREHMNSIIH